MTVKNPCGDAVSRDLRTLSRRVWGRSLAIAAASILAFAGLTPAALWASPGHGEDKTGQQMHMMEKAIEEHKGHAHEHDFEALKDMSPEDMRRVMNAMLEVGLAVPPMDSARGRELFLQKGCVVCHSVNGVGGVVGPSLDADQMPDPMNAFEFAARMWRGAPAMVELQEEILGDLVPLDGQELADIIAFAHDSEEQRRLTAEQIPESMRELVIE